jgi:hypothetical protein
MLSINKTKKHLESKFKNDKELNKLLDRTFYRPVCGYSELHSKLNPNRTISRFVNSWRNP